MTDTTQAEQNPKETETEPKWTKSFSFLFNETGEFAFKQAGTPLKAGDAATMEKVCGHLATRCLLEWDTNVIALADLRTQVQKIVNVVAPPAPVDDAPPVDEDPTQGELELDGTDSLEESPAQ